MRKAVALGLALLLSAAVADVWAAPLTLKQCVGLAVHDSPLLAGGIYDTEAARYEVDKQRGLLLPDTTGQLSVDELKGSPTTPFSVLNVPVPEENGGLSRQSTQNRR